MLEMRKEKWQRTIEGGEGRRDEIGGMDEE